jgi:uncharacterized protein YbjT (DUF2867 family)
MVAPENLGRAAAHLLTHAGPSGSVTYVEGPERYSAQDVAEAFEAATGRPVRPSVIPSDDWVAAFLKLGFSQPAAESYARMTAITCRGEYEQPEDAINGSVDLQTYIETLVRRPHPLPEGAQITPAA